MKAFFEGLLKRIKKKATIRAMWVESTAFRTLCYKTLWIIGKHREYGFKGFTDDLHQRKLEKLKIIKKSFLEKMFV